MTKENIEQISLEGPCSVCKDSGSNFIYKGVQKFSLGKDGQEKYFLNMYGCSNCRASFTIPINKYALDFI